jgi:hypothetical protein
MREILNDISVGNKSSNAIKLMRFFMINCHFTAINLLFYRFALEVENLEFMI